MIDRRGRYLELGDYVECVPDAGGHVVVARVMWLDVERLEDKREDVEIVLRASGRRPTTSIETSRTSGGSRWLAGLYAGFVRLFRPITSQETFEGGGGTFGGGGASGGW